MVNATIDDGTGVTIEYIQTIKNKNTDQFGSNTSSMRWAG